MHVALLTQSVAPPLTGIGRYAFELATRLPAAAGVSTCDLLNDFGWSGAEAIAAVGAVQSGAAPQSSRLGRLSLVRQRVARSELASLGYSLLAERSIRRHITSRCPQLLHCPNFYTPDVDCPLVVTVHDLSVLDHPEWHPRSRAKLVARSLERLNHRAAAVIVDSHHAAARLSALTPTDSAYVSVVHLAASPHYRPLTADTFDADARRFAELKSRLRLPEKFTLCVSTLEPRKNLVRLLGAYEALDATLRCSVPLVLVGARGWQDDSIRHQVDLAERSGWLKYVGYASEADLPLLYAKCRVFVYPSLYEGFGLPVLEAMQCGAPVIASEASSLPEVGGDAVLYCDATSVDSISMRLSEALTDEALRACLSSKGIERAMCFSWDKVIRETVDVYRRALQRDSL